MKSVPSCLHEYVSGFARVILAIISFYFMPTHCIFACTCYVTSALLDAFDGHAARYFNQSECLVRYLLIELQLLVRFSLPFLISFSVLNQLVDERLKACKLIKNIQEREQISGREKNSSYLYNCLTSSGFPKMLAIKRFHSFIPTFQVQNLVACWTS